MPEEERTNNGDYEYLDYHHFLPVSYDRLMSWKPGSGSIAWGRGTTVGEKTIMQKEDKVLPKENGVVVMNTDFKLVKR